VYLSSLHNQRNNSIGVNSVHPSFAEAKCLLGPRSKENLIYYEGKNLALITIGIMFFSGPELIGYYTLPYPSFYIISP
jgi:hypothetical protein